ncbi:unnamed protein product [Heligmosomoides polygyrus]|uniref:Uncharacterized protein n=1 Tax=Heligmosomoides polygyrus TaxID=6339 RepID=A0A3P7UBX9_HELPZ|nr:unnamed protein product [Heligmosomoides polygyrus]
MANIFDMDTYVLNVPDSAALGGAMLARYGGLFGCCTASVVAHSEGACSLIQGSWFEFRPCQPRLSPLEVAGIGTRPDWKGQKHHDT